VHNVAGGSPADVYLQGKQVLGNLPYKGVSDYLLLATGPTQLSVHSARGVNVNGEILLEPEHSYTVIIYGAPVVSLLFLEDDNRPILEMSKLRIVHAASTLPLVDLYTDMGLLYGPLGEGEITQPVYLEMPPGYVSLTVGQGEEHLIGPVPLKLERGGVYTVILSGQWDSEESPPTLLVTEDSHSTYVVL
jgi:hypothetical protein